MKMARLPQERMMDEVADRGELSREHLDAITARLAPFYAQAASNPGSTSSGSRPSSSITTRKISPASRTWWAR